MKVNELRIGNLVKYEGLNCLVLAVASHVVDWDLELGYFPDSIGFQRKIKDVGPIPLTEEWFFKCGFTPYGNLGNDWQLDSIRLFAGHHEFWFGWELETFGKAKGLPRFN